MFETIDIRRDALYSWRKQAYDRFLMLGLPKAKQAAFAYMSLSNLSIPAPAIAPDVDATQIAEQILPECKDNYLVFADGFFLPELSRASKNLPKNLPKNLIVLPLDTALQTYGLFLQNRWARRWKEETDPFCALNGAFHGQGVFLYVPPHVHCPQPLQIIQIVTENCLAAPRVQIVLGAQASLTIVQTLSTAGFCNNAMDLSLDAGAVLRFLNAEQLPSASYSLLSLRATLKQGAHLDATHVTNGSLAARYAASIELLEPHSSVAVRSLGMLCEEAQAHVHVRVDHAAPHTTSHQHVKMALSGKSKSSFAGEIFVQPSAQKTQAYQLNNNLLLSDAAAAYAKPHLEIFADDVKASHGATFTQPSDEELLYMRSRGLSPQEARSLLTRGFCHSIVEQIEIPSIRSLLAQTMDRVFHG